MPAVRGGGVSPRPDPAHPSLRPETQQHHDYPRGGYLRHRLQHLAGVLQGSAGDRCYPGLCGTGAVFPSRHPAPAPVHRPAGHRHGAHGLRCRRGDGASGCHHAHAGLRQRSGIPEPPCASHDPGTVLVHVLSVFGDGGAGNGGRYLRHHQQAHRRLRHRRHPVLRSDRAGARPLAQAGAPHHQLQAPAQPQLCFHHRPCHDQAAGGSVLRCTGDAPCFAGHPRH